MRPLDRMLQENLPSMELGIPPVVYDDCNSHGLLTKRLIILMKKAMRVLGDTPQYLALDGAQFFDLDQIPYGNEDCPVEHISEDLGLQWTLLPRELDSCAKNRFCVLVGEAGKVVLGAYPDTTVKPAFPGYPE